MYTQGPKAGQIGMMNFGSLILSRGKDGLMDKSDSWVAFESSVDT